MDTSVERSAGSEIRPRLRRWAVLPRDERAGRAARVVMLTVCSRWRLPHLFEVACACASELAANTVKHAHWPSDQPRALLSTAEVVGPFLVVEVRDPQPLPDEGWPGGGAKRRP